MKYPNKNTHIKLVILILIFNFLTYSQIIDTVFISSPTNTNNNYITDNDKILDTSNTKAFNDIVSVHSTHKIPDSSINYIYYQDIKELLYVFPGVFIYELGEFGYNHGITINYLDNRSFEIMQNTISTNDPLSGNIFINNFTIEDISKIEYINGAKAFLYGFNSNSGVINLVTKNLNAFKPYTKIRYNESANEETSLDGIYSQNITTNWNITFGLRRNASDGRFTNSAYDSWNLRFKTNYKFLKYFDSFFSMIYNQNKNGANGGIDLEKTKLDDAFDKLKATVKYENAYQKYTKNDLQLGFSGKFFNNPSNLTTLLFYLSNQIYYFNNSEHIEDYPYNFIKNHTRWTGIAFKQNLNLEETIFKPELHIGTETRLSQILQSTLMNYQKHLQNKIYVDLFFTPFEFLKVNTFSRLLTIKNTNTLDAGFNLSLSANDLININIGYSYSHRFPYELEEKLSNLINQNLPNEKYYIFDLSLQLSPINFVNLSINYLNNQVRDAIIVSPTLPRETNKPNFYFSSIEKLQRELLNTSLKINFWKIENTTNFIHNWKDKFINSLQTHPKFFVYSEIFYKDQFFNNKLFTKLGFRFRYYSEQMSYFYDNGFNVYYTNTSYLFGYFSFFDAILFFKIGNAIANICVENIFNTQCTMIYYYPLKDRSLRLGINWTFEN